MAACCLFADDDTLETDAAEFDCQSCVVADALDGLWPENRHAWTLSRHLITRFAFDSRAVPWLLDRITAGQELDDVFDLLERLSIIYNELIPLPPQHGN